MPVMLHGFIPDYEGKIAEIDSEAGDSRYKIKFDDGKFITLKVSVLKSVPVKVFGRLKEKN